MARGKCDSPDGEPVVYGTEQTGLRVAEALELEVVVSGSEARREISHMTNIRENQTLETIVEVQNLKTTDELGNQLCQVLAII